MSTQLNLTQQSLNPNQMGLAVWMSFYHLVPFKAISSVISLEEMSFSLHFAMPFFSISCPLGAFNLNKIIHQYWSIHKSVCYTQLNHLKWLPQSCPCLLPHLPSHTWTWFLFHLFLWLYSFLEHVFWLLRGCKTSGRNLQRQLKGQLLWYIILDNQESLFSNSDCSWLYKCFDGSVAI